MKTILDTLPVQQPTLILDKHKMLENLNRMRQKAETAGVAFRPHFKTHQSAGIGRLLKKQGIQTITVSSLTMAEKFASDGWQDITIAFPVNILEIDIINRLAGSVQLNLLLDNFETAAFLEQSLQHAVRVFIKVDVGNQRAGIRWDDSAQIVKLAQQLEACPHITFAGLLTHAGQTYSASGISEIEKIHRISLGRLGELKKQILAAGMASCQISVGDTPTCSLLEDFSGVDEIRPGNFVFYDVMQAELQACSYDDIAVTVACPVISKYPERGEILLYGGAVHFSKEYILDQQGQKVFGYLAHATADGWQGVDKTACLKTVSQEHGILKVSKTLLEQLKVGDRVLIYPVHSCLTANLLRSYTTTDGEHFHF